MKKQVVQIVSVFVMLTFLTSCATIPSDTKRLAQQADQQPTSQAEQSTSQDAANSPSETDSVAPQADQGTTPKTAPNSAERQIISQAIAGGALVGAAIGAGVGALLDGKNPGIGALLGGAAGALLGGVAGAVVGKRQIENYRNIKLSNEKFEKLLASAQEYNNNVATYNNNLEQDIALLKNKTKPEQEKIAKDKLKEAEEQRQNLELAINEREKLSQILVQPQMVEYQKTLADLNQEGQKLDGIIKKLRSISEPARIGS